MTATFFPQTIDRFNQAGELSVKEDGKDGEVCLKVPHGGGEGEGDKLWE